MENIQTLKLQLLEALDKYIEAKLATQKQVPQQSTQQVPQQATQQSTTQSTTCKIISFERRPMKNGQMQVRVMTDAGMMFMYASSFDKQCSRDLQKDDEIEVEFDVKNGYKCIKNIFLAVVEPEDIIDDENLPF